jgi:hypothetical protein
VNEDYKGEKPVMDIAPHSGQSHSTIAMVLKYKNKVTEAVEQSTSLKAMKLTKLWEEPMLVIKKLLMTWMEEQTQSVSLSASSRSQHQSKNIFLQC